MKSVTYAKSHLQFSRPSYQDGAVSTFLDKLAPGTFKDLFNAYVPEALLLTAYTDFPTFLALDAYVSPCFLSFGSLNATYLSSFSQAFPDVSAQADNFRIFFQGEPGLIGGTSAAAPTFAGFVSLLNDARLSKGLKPLGFLNPFLYSRGVEGLNDITEGNNPGCGTQGFNATQGWDPGMLQNSSHSLK